MNAPLPKDPFILLSLINMKLRDQYASLDALCDDMDASRREIEEALKTIGFRYDEDKNAFV